MYITIFSPKFTRFFNPNCHLWFVRNKTTRNVCKNKKQISNRTSVFWGENKKQNHPKFHGVSYKK